MELFNFNTAYTQLYELYGIELKPDEFENMGIIAWNKIGNKLYTLKEETLEVVDRKVTLPCEADQIEAVYMAMPDYQATSNVENLPMMYNQFTEQYINLRRNSNTDVLYKDRKLVKYRILDGSTLETNFDSGTITVLYKSVLYDDCGLPQLNYKEVDAIAAYCAYAYTFKKSIMTRDQATMQIAQMLEMQWYRLCDHARTSMYLSQNDFDEIGDVKLSWDRKSYGKTHKPLK